MKPLMIVAIILICVGLLVAFFALLSVKFDVRLFSSVQYEEKEAVIADSFSDISISLDTSEVKILPATDDTVRIVYDDPKPEKMSVDISVKDGKLTVSLQDTRKWYEKISIFNFGRHEVVIYLPAGAYGALDLRLSTGKIAVEKGLTFAAASIVRSTGDLDFGATITGEMNILSTTGETMLSGSVGSLKLKSTTGDVRLFDLTVLGSMEITRTTGDLVILRTAAADVNLKGSTGDVEANTMTVTGDMSITSTTGEIELAHTVIGGHLEIVSDTGDVELERSDAATLKITTDTGDVSGSLLTDKQFFAHSDTGRVRVPKTTGGLCEIDTDTGNIDFLGED